MLTRSARSAAKADGEAEPEAGVDAEEKAEPEPEPDNVRRSQQSTPKMPRLRTDALPLLSRCHRR